MMAGDIMVGGKVLKMLQDTRRATIKSGSEFSGEVCTFVLVQNPVDPCPPNTDQGVSK